MRRSRLLEILAVDVLHRDERAAIDFADVVDAADVGMRDLAGDADFGMEACQQGFVPCRGLR